MAAASPIIDGLFARLESSLRARGSQSLFEDGAPIYLYGAGNIGKDVCRLLKQGGANVVAFLDRNAKPGTIWQGVPILTPDDPSISTSERKRAHVAIGIFNRDSEIPPIVELLRSLGYQRVSTFLEVYEEFAAELGERFWLGPRDFYLDKKEIASSAYALWGDEASRELFAAVLKFRFEQDYTVLPVANPKDQYFPMGLPAWPSPLRFVDCGAYDGDTVLQLLNEKLRVEALATFEPDPVNFEKLKEVVRKHASKLPKEIILSPCGASDAAKEIRFNSGLGSSSSVSAEGETTIQCVALDEVLADFRPNVIKMDIEGAEVDALLGARQIIERWRPGLAISVYHRPDHLWTIPLMAQSWLKGGRHYLRAHAFNAFELIYYWMP